MKTSILALALWAAIALPAAAQAGPLDDVLAAAAKAGFSGVVLSADADGPGRTLTFGMADEARRIRHTAGEIWPWASVTKQVAAVLVMQEVERGRLKLDAPISAYLPDFKGPTAAQVTVRQLLLHTSGLPNPNATAASPDDVPPFYLETGSRIAQQARTKAYCSGAPIGEPGAAFSYNNCDYLVLGALLEKVSGQSYATLIKTRIAKPLRLKTLRPAPDKVAIGYGDLKGHDSAGKPAPAMNIATLGAAGDLVGSAADLLAFDRALMAGKLLSATSLAELWKGDPKLGYAALGAWAFPAGLKGCTGSVDLVERRGDFAGVQVRNIFAPRLGKVLIVFTNRNDLDFGEIWQGKGLSFDLLSAAFCAAR